MTIAPIHLTLRLWRETWEGLRRRGEGVRETACIWGGTRTAGAQRVETVVFIDDLDGVHAAAYSHVVQPKAVQRALEALRVGGLVVVADIHTHPHGWVDLSPIDRENPIEFRVGLAALVLPFFANVEPSLAKAGVHEYLGARRWRQLDAAEAAIAVIIEGTP